MPIELREADVIRYYVREDFNPGSHKQILGYMKAKGLAGRPNPKSKSGLPSTDKDTLRRLARRDPLFRLILDWREVDKINSTYVIPNLQRVGDSGDGRIHPSFRHTPSTMRLSSHDPNIQNIPTVEGTDDLATKLRRTITAAEGCLFVETDYAAIEAVLTGHFMADPNFMRVARWAHTYALAMMREEGPNLSMSDDDLAGFLTAYKKQVKGTKEYAAMKRAVHLTHYGGTPRMMNLAHPELFPTINDAEKLQNRYFELVPNLRKWQRDVRTRAAAQHYLGGKDHPYRYKHWFWDVVAWNPRRGGEGPGSDWNRVVAYYPQSTAAGVLYDAALRMTDPGSPYYVGDLYYGKTPIRALIHDSILAEVPKSNLSTYLERCLGAMGVPLAWTGTNLVIGVDVQVGKDWGSMKPLKEVT